MKKLWPVALALAVAATTAFGALGDVVASWPSPTGGMFAAFGTSNSYLYVLATPYTQVHIMDITSGSVVGSFASAAADLSCGLAYVSGGYLWQGRSFFAPYLFYETDANNGSIYASLPSPSAVNRGVAPLCTGDGGVGTTALLSTTCARPYLLHHVDMTTGSIIASYSISAPIYDNAYDWRNQLVWGAWMSPTVRGYTTTGSLVTSFTAPIQVFGAAYNGEYLYVGGNAPYFVYKIHCPGNIGISPASMGRIKATFR